MNLFKYLLILASVVFSMPLVGQEAPQEQLSFSLDEAVAYGLKNSYAIKNAENDILLAIKKKWETTTIGLPQIDATANYNNFLKLPVSLIPTELFGGVAGEFAEVSFGTKQTMNAGITLRQFIFDASYIVAMQSAKTFMKISQSAKEKTEWSIKEAIVNAYGNVLLTEESIKILEKNKEILEKNLSQTREIVKNGLAEEQNVEQLEITFATINNQLNRAKRSEGIVYKMLNFAMGIDVDQKLALKDDLKSLGEKSNQLELLSTPFNINNHIDYRIASNGIESNMKLMKLERSKYYPSLFASLNYTQSANNDQFRFFENSQKWFESSVLGFTLNVPIFSSFNRKSKVQQARINIEKSKIQLTETSQRLKLNLETARSDYQFSIEQYATTESNLKLAERIERKEQIKFLEGISSSFQLTEAQQQLYSIQQQYLQSILEVINTKVKLESALNITTQK